MYGTVAAGIEASTIFSMGVVYGWLNSGGKPEKDDLQRFLEGASGAVGAGFGPGIAYRRSFDPVVKHTAIELSISTPYAGVSGSHTTYVGKVLPYYEDPFDFIDTEYLPYVYY